MTLVGGIQPTIGGEPGADFWTGGGFHDGRGAAEQSGSLVETALVGYLQCQFHKCRTDGGGIGSEQAGLDIQRIAIGLLGGRIVATGASCAARGAQLQIAEIVIGIGVQNPGREVGFDGGCSRGGTRDRRARSGGNRCGQDIDHARQTIGQNQASRRLRGKHHMRGVPYPGCAGEKIGTGIQALAAVAAQTCRGAVGR